MLAILLEGRAAVVAACNYLDMIQGPGFARHAGVT
jgi:hypothetical protein